MTRIKVSACRSAQTSPLMSAAYGLPLVGILIIVLVLVRDVARRAKLRRRPAIRKGERFYWQPADRSERSQMRETADNTTVMNTIARGSRRKSKSRD